MMMYRFLTMLIICLARLRKSCGKNWVMRVERDDHNLIPGYSFKAGSKSFLIECCDCGLAHQFFEDEKGVHGIPERPKGYDYKWRLGS